MTNEDAKSASKAAVEGESGEASQQASSLRSVGRKLLTIGASAMAVLLLTSPLFVIGRDVLSSVFADSSVVDDNECNGSTYIMAKRTRPASQPVAATKPSDKIAAGGVGVQTTCPTQPAGPKPLPAVKVLGNRFVTEDGRIITFRGLDTSDPDKLLRDGQWNRRYFEIARGWGSNIVRFPVHPDAWRRQGKENYIKLLDQGVQWAAELGMYVIIDWHSIGNLRSEIFTDPMYDTTKKETFEFWLTMARHYKGNTTVAFFEVFNEPVLVDGGCCWGVCSWSQWKEIVEEIIVIIRGNGSKAIPLVAGFNWAYDLTHVATDPINAEGIGYVSHPYPGKRKPPWIADWEKDWGFVADKYPVFLTEMGFCDAAEGEHSMFGDDETYGDAMTGYCDKKGISYTVWTLDPDWSGMVIKDWDFTPTRGGRYFRSAMQKANGTGGIELK